MRLGQEERGPDLQRVQGMWGQRGSVGSRPGPWVLPSRSCVEMKALEPNRSPIQGQSRKGPLPVACETGLGLWVSSQQAMGRGCSGQGQLNPDGSTGWRNGPIHPSSPLSDTSSFSQGSVSSCLRRSGHYCPPLWSWRSFCPFEKEEGRRVMGLNACILSRMPLQAPTAWALSAPDPSSGSPL